MAVGDDEIVQMLLQTNARASTPRLVVIAHQQYVLELIASPIKSPRMSSATVKLKSDEGSKLGPMGYSEAREVKGRFEGVQGNKVTAALRNS